MNTHTIITDIRQDVSKIREDIGSQNRAVCDMWTFYCFSIHANRHLDSEQVRNLDCREIQV